MIRLFVSAILFVTSAFAQSSLPNGFVRFAGTDPNLPSNDLKAILEPTVSNAQIVAIGESVHGSSEYTKLQHRIVKYLVEQKGFRIFVLENPRLRSEGMTAALSRCDGSPLPMDLLYFPAEDDRALFEWARKYNCSHRSDPIRFRGLDIWDRYWDMQARIISEGKTLKIPNIEAYDPVMKNHCLGHGLNNWEEYKAVKEMLKREKHIPKEHYEPCMKAFSNLIRYSETAYAVANPVNKPVWARYLQVLNTAYSRQENLNYYYSDDFTSDWNARDRGQARNVFNIMREFGLNQKVIWIAHTSHTSHMRSGSDWWKLGIGRFQSGVYFFEQMYKKRITNIMLTSYRASGAQGDWAVPTSPDSMDLYLHNLGEKYVAFNPRSSFVRSKKRWWLQNENYDHPSTYRDGVYMVPEDNFDLFFFINETLKGQKIEPWHSPWEW